MGSGGIAAGAVVVGLIAAAPVMGGGGDAGDAVADGNMAALRSAVGQANNDPSDDTITLPARSTYLLDGQAGENGNATGDLDILPGSGTLTVDGNGATLDAQGIDRFFDVLGGQLVLNDVTIVNGRAPGVERGGAVRGAAGSAITVDGGSLSADTTTTDNGGPIATTGALTVNGADITDADPSAPGTVFGPGTGGVSPPATAVPVQPDYTG